MSGKGDRWDNAVAESFFATLRAELVDHERFSTRQAAIDAIADYICAATRACRSCLPLCVRTTLHSESRLTIKKKLRRWARTATEFQQRAGRRPKILGAVGALLTSPRNILELRRLVKERLRTLSQSQDQDLRQAQTRLASTEAKISRLIEAVSEGISSPYLAQSLKDLEAQATADKTTIGRLTALPSQGLVLPHPALLVQQALNLHEMFARDPFAGREALRRLLDGQSVVLRPDPSGHYVAEATLFPLLTLDRESSREVRGPAVGCAGAMRPMYHEVWLEIRLQLSA
jgi:hypothetical protein